MKNDFHDALLRHDFSCFISKVFQTINPQTEYLHSWHIDLIADRLTRASKGGGRLIVNVPPRSLKSICVSVAWPAWILGHNPAARIMVASYSQILSLKHSTDTRHVMQSKWYRELFPETIIAGDENEKAKFVTTRRGFRFATSVGGTATGEGGDFLIIDDPHNPQQAASDVQRQAALDWLDQTFMSRLNNKKKGTVVVVMQRLHGNDLTGHILSKSSTRWEHICLPAIAEEKMIYSFYGKNFVRNVGDFLHPDREGAEEIARAKEDLGSAAFASQYQQLPIVQNGGMVRVEWFCRYDTEPQIGRIVQSWDTAIKAGKSNDFSVCTSWKECERGYFLLDVVCMRLEYPELKRTSIALAEKWSPDVILIEDKASGQSLLQDLKRETKLPCVAVRPVGDKISRFAAVTAMIEAGRVFIPNRSAWLADFEMQILSFPNAAHDDMVDSMTQFLSWARARKNSEPRMRVV